jgi:hypothetical protein
LLPAQQLNAIVRLQERSAVGRLLCRFLSIREDRSIMTRTVRDGGDTVPTLVIDSGPFQ